METEHTTTSRRLLMEASANGDACAQQKLRQEYRIWIFSPPADNPMTDEPTSEKVVPSSKVSG